MSRPLEAPPSSLSWNLTEADGAWSGRSSGLLLLVAGGYWLATWLAAGLPPLAALASRGLGERHRSKRFETRIGDTRTA